MISFISSTLSIGLERNSFGIKVAKISGNGSGNTLNSLLTITPEIDNVKPLYIHHPILTTGLGGKDVLIRPLTLPLTKEKDIQEALIFQAEPLLPFPIDQAFLAYQVISKGAESTDLTLLAVRKDTVQVHLDPWIQLGIQPEKVGSVASAICEFSTTYLKEIKTCLILHLQDQEMICCLIKEGKLWASFSQSEGLKLLLDALEEDQEDVLHNSKEEWKRLLDHPKGKLAEALKRLQKETTKLGFALSKECKSDSIEGIFITGEAAKWEGFCQVLVENLQFPLLTCPPIQGYTSQELLTYAVPIGLGIGSLPGRQHQVDFRQQEYTYPHSWKRLRIPLISYLVGVCLLTFAFYFFGQQYLSYQKSQIKQDYIDLLANLNKTHENFEISFATKNSKSKEIDKNELPQIEDLSQEDLHLRLAFLQQELQTAPDSFPLFANLPRVSDVLAWLSQHPAVIFVDEEGNQRPKLKIDNFNYTMVKRPQQGKKQEKYQVKIDVEFTSETPKWAREFHDALITPNDWIDPKGEVKWNSSRGKYKTSFFLKDKTAYPS